MWRGSPERGVGSTIAHTPNTYLVVTTLLVLSDCSLLVKQITETARIGVVPMSSIIPNGSRGVTNTLRYHCIVKQKYLPNCGR